MKWPARLTLIRHGESAYNVLKAKKEVDPLYQKFLQAYKEDFYTLGTRQIAKAIREKWALGCSDYDTPLTELGTNQARVTGFRLMEADTPPPHVIFVSPYLRTRKTLEALTASWPSLAKVKVVVDDRIREQEHGLSLLYNDWRVFHVMHPEQRDLRELMGLYWYRYPQGESVCDVRDRFHDFQAMLIREYSDQRVLVVTHHLTILSARANLERLQSPEQFIEMDEHDKPINCGVTVYKGCPSEGTAGKLKLQSYNKKYW